ncbi:GNAT family N-acetyltransferase [Streptomyces purpureus]|uniref:Ribosomal-protein-alanine acetyltransferase n=1 Tax=Streptomyces purpureus TaxID=1951 RepID=A0A918H007_9ACTN|nr:GNAT family protein [Streptomyces purpureus]GGT27327.1 putative ribosomal-protein-alanine acetyltransferase [Streptomyces purpureus]
MSLSIRPAEPSDAPALAAALLRNRAYTQPREPRRDASYYTAEAQAERLAAPGTRMWFAVDRERIAAAATLSGIARGPFCSANLGYWVDEEYAGKGLATRLVEEVCRAAREELGLHRVEAGTMLDNAASQRVLAKTGFERYGTAPRYLHIDGEWRDHHIFQRILHDDPPAP